MEQRPFNVYAQNCPSRAVFEAIFSRWGILVLGHLLEGPNRFGEIRRSVDGISEKMLTQTLKVLEQEGLATRWVKSEKPLWVEYSLTEEGQLIAHGIRGVIADLYAVLDSRRGEHGQEGVR